MPAAYRLLRRSGPHRIAALALYRALLLQCRRVSLPQRQHDELQNLVRNRFKQARGDQSTTQLRVSFEAGYEAIDLLDAAVTGIEESKDRILKLLEDAPLKARQAYTGPSIPVTKREKIDKASVENTAVPAKPKHSLFDRPLPLSELSGKRHVPRLVNANHIPILRVKKPQPEHLSGFLSHRIKQRQKRYDRKDRIIDELSVAEGEDEWDDIIDEIQEKENRHIGQAMTADGDDDPSWCEALDAELFKVNRQLSGEKRKNKEMAEKMQAVVDRETALFEEERAERKGVRAKTRSLEPQDGDEDRRAGVAKHMKNLEAGSFSAGDSEPAHSDTVFRPMINSSRVSDI